MWLGLVFWLDWLSDTIFESCCFHLRICKPTEQRPCQLDAIQDKWLVFSCLCSYTVFQYHPKNTQKWNLSSREWDDSSIWVGGRTSTRLSGLKGLKLRSAFSALGEVTE